VGNDKAFLPGQILKKHGDCYSTTLELPRSQLTFSMASGMPGATVAISGVNVLMRLPSLAEARKKAPGGC